MWYQTLKIGLSSDVSDSSIYPIKTILRWDRLTTLKEVKNKIQREKRIAKIIFWCFTPFFFIAFLRFFFMIFNFIYGTILRFIFGKKYGDIITVIAIFTALFFTVAVCSMLWKQYKKHILESWISSVDSKNSSSRVKTKQQSVQFGEMTPHQLSQLDRFLEKCTIR